MHRKERGGRGNRCTGRSGRRGNRCTGKSGDGGAIGAQKEWGGRGNRCTGRSGDGGAIGAQEGVGRAGQEVTDVCTVTMEVACPQEYISPWCTAGRAGGKR